MEIYKSKLYLSRMSCGFVKFTSKTLSDFYIFHQIHGNNYLNTRFFEVVRVSGNKIIFDIKLKIYHFVLHVFDNFVNEEKTS